ncbi:MAG: hypothetical protein JW894_10590 [Bacteroidales bacterium]|nr:hypothetical protein [Bacteroidales bacterium]
MKKLSISLGFAAFLVIIGFQCASGQEVYDTIFKIEGKVLPVDVVKVTPQYVSFIVPGNPETYTMERKEVQKIVYKNGRVEEFNKPVFEMIDEYSWEAVWLTEDKKEVAELYRRGVASANSPSSVRSPKAAKKNAIIRLQKKAASMKGTVVLVTKKKATGGYGEYPGYYIEGIVYGLEPLKEEEYEDENTAMDGKVVF